MSEVFKAYQKFLEKWTYLAGLNFFSRPQKWKEIAYGRLLLAGAYGILLFHLIFTYDSLNNQGLAIIGVGATCSAGLCIKIRSDLIKDAKVFCELLDNWKNKRSAICRLTSHPVVKRSVEKNLLKAEKRALLCVKIWFYVFVVGGTTFMFLVGSLIGFILPDDIFPKYSLPLPAHLPGLPSTDLKSFLINVILEGIMTMPLLHFVALYISLLISLLCYFFAQLEILQELCDSMHFLEETNGQWINRENFTIEEFIKVFVELHSDLLRLDFNI